MPSVDYKRCVICEELFKTKRPKRKTCGRAACQKRHNANLAKKPGYLKRSRAYFARWYQQNKAKVIARVTANKARKVGSSSQVTPSESS